MEAFFNNCFSYYVEWQGRRQGIVNAGGGKPWNSGRGIFKIGEVYKQKVAE